MSVELTTRGWIGGKYLDVEFVVHPAIEGGWNHPSYPAYLEVVKVVEIHDHYMKTLDFNHTDNPLLSRIEELCWMEYDAYTEGIV